jgi:predicted negative regulator of RcsB-dependent stress response
MLESTLIPLELYFEHRNYLPIIGPVYALCMLAVQVPLQRRKIACAGIAVYLAINALVLLGQTSLWGNPAVAANIWQQRSPESARAATTAVTYKLAHDGLRSGVESLRHLVEEHPEAGYVKVQELNLRCIVAPDEDTQRTVDELEALLKGVDFSYTAGTMLSELFTTVSNVECNGVDNDTVRSLARSLLSNPRYTGDSRYNQIHHQLMARISRHEGKYDRTIQHLERASEYGASSDLNMMIVTTLADAEDFDSARNYIEEARQVGPKHPIKAHLWQRDLDGLSNYVDAMERHAEHKDASDSKSQAELP